MDTVSFHANAEDAARLARLGGSPTEAIRRALAIADRVERSRMLEDEATELAADHADRAEIAELRSLLGEPWAGLPG